MKKSTTALIAAILAITFTNNASAVDRFIGHKNNVHATIVCSTAQVMAEYIDASIRHDTYEMSAITKNKECVLVDDYNVEFEVLGNNRYMSEIAFYGENCKLQQTKFYVDNRSIDSKDIKSSKYKPPVCEKNQTSNTTIKLVEVIEPESLIVCFNYELAEQLMKSEDGFPKGCFDGQATKYAQVKQIKGDFVEVSFKLDDGSFSDPYWLSKKDIK